MNSVIRQTTRLGARSLRLSARQPTARKFSLASQVFETNTMIKNGAKPDYKRLAKHVVDPLLLYVFLSLYSSQLFLEYMLTFLHSYFPFMALVIGWPLLAEQVVDGNV